MPLIMFMLHSGQCKLLLSFSDMTFATELKGAT
jgi:hypothetical protein